jgi:RNA polymerase sigma factor (sigma-70 family)
VNKSRDRASSGSREASASPATPPGMGSAAVGGFKQSAAFGDGAMLRTASSRASPRRNRDKRSTSSAGDASFLLRWPAPGSHFSPHWGLPPLATGQNTQSGWRFKSLSALHRCREISLDETTIELIEDSASSPEQTVLNQDLSAQLRTCLSQMSREHREVIDLVYHREKSIDEVAKITGTPKNTVKTRVYYARKRLAGLLTRGGNFEQPSTRRAA